MKQYLHIEFNRPIDPDKDFIAFGSTTIGVKGGLVDVSWDFEEASSSVDKSNPKALTAELKNLEPDVPYEDLKDLYEHIDEIEKMELWIHVGDSDIEPVRIIDAALAEGLNEHHFSKTALKNVKFFVEE